MIFFNERKLVINEVVNGVSDCVSPINLGVNLRRALLIHAGWHILATEEMCFPETGINEYINENVSGGDGVFTRSNSEHIFTSETVHMPSADLIKTDDDINDFALRIEVDRSAVKKWLEEESLRHGHERYTLEGVFILDAKRLYKSITGHTSRLRAGLAGFFGA